MSDETLDLPNPGFGRYWDISFDSDSHSFLLILRNGRGARLLERGLSGDQSFEAAAHDMIDLLAKRDVLVGSYTFEETN